MRFWLLLFIGLFGVASLRAAGGFSHRVVMDPESRDSIEVSSFVDNTPGAGFMPLKVVIDNRSTSDRVWALRPMMSMNDWVHGEWNFPVKAGQRSEFEIYVPLKVSNFDYRWGLQFMWSGPGVESNMMQLPQTGSSSNAGKHSFIGLSDSLHTQHWGTLQSALADLNGAALDLTQAPADWRAWLALDQIWMTVGEWKTLPRDRKQALLEAVALRNELVLVCADKPEADEMRNSFNRGESAQTDWPLGAGRVRLQLSGGDRAATVQKGPQRGNTLQSYRLSSQLAKQVPEIETAGPLVLLFIVLFGIVAGPVNLFVLAPAGRRHRLFITTPLISLAGAVVLAAAIFIQDGTGGSGVRLVHAQVLPDSKRLLITQEQAARTGLLVGTSFRTADPVWLQPLADTAMHAYRQVRNQYSLAADGSFTGDWFRSRSRQHHVLQSVRPSRAAIEFTAGEAPSVVSTFETELTRLFVYDAEGKAWSAENVRSGERVPLKPADKDAPQQFWNEQGSQHDLQGLLGDSRARSHSRTASFYAEAADPASMAIDTLPSIRWQTPVVLVSGPLTLKP